MLKDLSGSHGRPKAGTIQASSGAFGKDSAVSGDEKRVAALSLGHRRRSTHTPFFPIHQIGIEIHRPDLKKRVKVSMLIGEFSLRILVCWIPIVWLNAATKRAETKLEIEEDPKESQLSAVLNRSSRLPDVDTLPASAKEGTILAAEF